MPFIIDDRDLEAFLIYAARERSLDASMQQSERHGRSSEHRESIALLRELNRRLLIRDTTRMRF
jgi:hypothetical protein